MRCTRSPIAADTDDVDIVPHTESDLPSGNAGEINTSPLSSGPKPEWECQVTSIFARRVQIKSVNRYLTTA